MINFFFSSCSQTDLHFYEYWIPVHRRQDTGLYLNWLGSECTALWNAYDAPGNVASSGGETLLRGTK